MANTGILLIDVAKTVDIVSSNNINVHSIAGNINIGANNGAIDVSANGIMTVNSNTGIVLEAPYITLDTDVLNLVGNSGYAINSVTDRVLELESAVYTPNTSGTGLVTRALLTSVQNVLAGNTEAVAIDLTTLEAVVYDPSTGLANTRALTTSLSSALASNVAALSTRIDSVTATANVSNRTYIQGSAPTTPPFSLVTGDLWFDTAHNYRISRWSSTEWILLEDQRIAGLVADVTTESTARVANDAALATRIDTTLAIANNALAAVQTETEARIANGVSTASLIESIQSQVANNSARIDSEAQTRADGDSALFTYVDTKVAAAGAGNVRTYVRSTAPSNPTAGDLWFDLDDNYKMYRYSGNEWVLVSDERIAASVSAITAEQNARVAADEATTIQIESAFSRIANSESWISDVETTLTNANESLAQQVSQLQVQTGGIGTTYVQADEPAGAQVGQVWFDSNDDYKMYRFTYYPSGNTWTLVSDTRIDTALSNITSETNARIANNTSMTNRIDSAFTRIANSESWITTVETNLAGNNESTASTLNTLSSRVYAAKTFSQGTAPTATANGDLWYDTSNNNLVHRWNGTSWQPVADGRIATAQTDISSLNTTVATLNSSVATMSTNINARFNINEADIQSLKTSFADDNKAYAQSFENLSASINDVSASVTTAASAAATAENGVTSLKAQASLVVNGGRITGYKATSTADTSEFIIQADRFKVQSGSGAGTQTPFSVIDGVTYINNAVIGNGAIDTNRLATNSVTDYYSILRQETISGNVDQYVYIDIPYITGTPKILAFASVAQGFPYGESSGKGQWNLKLGAEFIDGPNVGGNYDSSFLAAGGMKTADSVSLQGAILGAANGTLRVYLRKYNSSSYNTIGSASLTVIVQKR